MPDFGTRGKGWGDKMDDRMLICNKTKLFKLADMVLQEHLPEKYELFKHIKMKDMEYRQSRKYGGWYELQFRLGEDLATCDLRIFCKEPCFRVRYGPEFMGGGYKYDKIFVLAQKQLEGLGMVKKEIEAAS